MWPWIASASLFAIDKTGEGKPEGARPIGAGTVYRRLAWRCALAIDADRIASLFLPHQFACCVPGGVEFCHHIVRIAGELFDGAEIPHVKISADASNFFNEVDRVIARRAGPAGGTPDWLVKWRGLPHASATWESCLTMLGFQNAIRRFLAAEHATPTPEELAVAHAEGSPAGPLLRAINAIADAIVDEFPLVAIDTLGEACFFLTSLVLYYGTRSFTKTGSGRT